MVEMTPPIYIEAYNPAWPRLFEAEKILLESHFKFQLSGIEHIGSTAIPGLGSKPILDIAVGITKKTDYAALIPELNTMDYVFSHEEDETLWLTFKKKINPEFTANLHMVLFNGKEWKRWLAVRDYLRAHEEVVQKYYELKKELAKKFRYDPKNYSEGKSEFIKELEHACGLE